MWAALLQNAHTWPKAILLIQYSILKTKRSCFISYIQGKRTLLAGRSYEHALPGFLKSRSSTAELPKERETVLSMRKVSMRAWTYTRMESASVTIQVELLLIQTSLLAEAGTMVRINWPSEPFQSAT